MTERQLRYRLRRCGYSLMKRGDCYAILAASSYAANYPVFGLAAGGTECTASFGEVLEWCQDRGIL